MMIGVVLFLPSKQMVTGSNPVAITSFKKPHGKRGFVFTERLKAISFHN